jgi:ABC-type branched-subunit amino acid transport system substrate-binding protein
MRLARQKVLGIGAVAATVLAMVAGCSSSSNSAGSGKTINVGVLTDLTGAAASGNSTSLRGAQAGVVLAKRDGYTIKLFQGDTATSPASALTAAQKLVQQNHVVAVVANSALTFSAAPFLTAQNIPVVGLAEDSNEWNTSKNMFPITGPYQTNVVTSTYGDYFKMEGVSDLGSLGYSVSPSSAGAAKTAAASARAAGIRVGYLNANFPFGSTNVAPEAIAMKNAGVNGFTATVDPNTSFALITALRQNNVSIKAALLPTGYGGDLTQAGPGAVQAGQGVSFSLAFEPVEMNTSATQQFQKDLQAAGFSSEPTFAEYNGYVSMGLLVRAFKAAGSNITPASIITALSGIHNWNALGLWGGRTLDINDRTQKINGVDNCQWMAKLAGNAFQLVPGADPLCGKTIGTT